jgi:integrase
VTRVSVSSTFALSVTASKFLCTEPVSARTVWRKSWTALSWPTLCCFQARDHGGSVRVRHALSPPHVQSLGRSAQRVRSRSIPLPPETVAALKAHRKAQLAEKMLLGPDYSDDDLVFCRGDGTKLHPTTFSRRFNQLAHSAKLRRIRLHDLRHTFATLALQAAVPVKIVSEILGHASVTLTYDTYSHVIPGMGEDATSKVAALVFGTRSLP